MRGRSFTVNQAIGALAGVVALVGTPGPVQAQSALDSPTNSGIHLGPVALSPVFRLSEFGFDSNVYNLSEDSNPVGDFTSKLSPSVDASLRSSHVRAGGRSQFDFYYFKTLPTLNAVDSDNAAQVELMVNRLTLSFRGGRTSTRHRQNLEIDAIARRQTGDVSVGAAVRLTGKTSFDVSVARSHLEYEANSFYLGTDLAQALNNTSTGVSIGVRYAMTHLTTFSVGVARDRARFDSALDRNSEELRITPSVEFSPFALVSGRASFGYYKRTFPAAESQSSSGSSPSGGSLPSGGSQQSIGESESSGTSALVDLNYTLLGRTRFTIGVVRRLEYSYLTVLYTYVEAGVTGTVTQRLGESWDVVGRLGRARLTYQQSAPTDVAVAQIPSETVLTSGVDVGYNVRHTRIGLYVEHNQRDTDQSAPNRGYQRLRIGTSATYVF